MANKGDIYKVALPNGDEYNFKDKYVRENYRALNNNDFDTINVTELNAGNVIVTGAARFLNTINGSISGNAATASDSAKLNGYASDTSATNNTIARRTANGYIFATYFNQSSGAETPTSSSYVIYANSDGYFRKSSIANMKTAMSLNNVENKSSATIRGELTSANVTTALGYTPVNKAGDTMSGSLHFTSSAPLVYDWVHTTESPMIVLKDSPNYGIRYKEGDPDTMKFSASGNANTNNADLCINGAGDGTVTIRGNTIIHAGNYTSYTVKKDGTGASGTWGISISGNAATATTSTTANSVAWGNVSGRPTKLSQFTNDITFATSIASSTDTSEITLAHNGVYTLTAGGTSFVFKMPSSGNTDTKVRQTLVTDTDNTNRPLLLAYSNTSTTTGNVDNISYRANTIYANASTGTITATKFVGDISGGTGLTKSQVTTALGYTPPTSDTNTHRPIQMNGTEILGNNTTALNLKAGTNVSLSNSSGTVTITATDTTYSAGTGLTLSGTQFSVSSANASTIMNLLTTGSSAPTDNDYYIAQYAGGGTSTTTYHRRPHSALWSYIKSKADSTYLASTTKYAGSSSVGGAANSANQLNDDTSYINSGTSYVTHTTASTLRPFLTRFNNVGIGTESHGCLVLSNNWSSNVYNAELLLGMGDRPYIYFRGKNNGTYTTWLPVGKFSAVPTTGQVVITDGTEGGIKSSGYTIAKSVPSNAVFTDTNYYHTTGSWSGLTYTATANGGAGALAFTIPTGATATTVAVGNHNHNGTYVKVAGDSMTGTLCMNSTNGNYGEGIRINAGNGGYSSFTLGTAANSTSGISDCGFWIGTNITNATHQRKLYIAHNSSTASGTYFYASSATQSSPNLRIGSDLLVVGTTYVNASSSGTSAGIALYGTSAPTSYGITMRGTATSSGQLGKHGYVQGDWAGYLCFDGAVNRGYIFRQAGNNIASISGEGHAVFNGSVTVGGNATNTSGVRQVYNSTTQSLDFVFVA